MHKTVIWVHDKALNKEHKALHNLDKQSLAIFIWDDEYFRNRSYSLRRLAFIYETLCQMPLVPAKGNIFAHIESLAPAKIKTFFTANRQIKQMIDKLSSSYEVEIIKPQPFVILAEDKQYKRFFSYWNQAQKTAFLNNGGLDV